MPSQQPKTRVRASSARRPASAVPVRVGVDIVSVSRLASSVARIASLGPRLFSDAERRFSDELPPKRRTEWLAGRFAAKEAIAKALGRNVYDTDLAKLVEVMPSSTGSPTVRYLDKELAKELDELHCDVSISHAVGFAVAVAVVVPRPGNCAP